MSEKKRNLASVIADLADCQHATPSAAENLLGSQASPLVASKGAGSIHALRRRRGAAWQYIGYAVWSCRQQRWVLGSWDTPVAMAEAAEYLADMDYGG